MRPRSARTALIRPATKIGLEILAGLVAVAVLLAGAAAWRLSQGPLPVDFLTSLVEDAVNAQIDGYEVEIGGMAIVWTGDEGALELKALDVRLVGGDGRTVAEFPGFVTDFNARAALAGRLVPRRLAFDAPSLTLVRRADGGLRFGLTDMSGLGGARLDAPTDPPLDADAGSNADSVIGTLLDAVSERGAGEAAGMRLESISIRNASVTIFDQRSEGLWLAPDVDLEFRNTPRGMAGMVRAQVLSPGGEWNLVGTLRSADDGEHILLSAEVADITLPDFSRTLVVLEPLAMVDAKVSGRVVARLTRRDLGIADLEIDFEAGPGVLRLPLDQPEPFVPPVPLGFDGEPGAPEPAPPWTPRPWTYDLEGARIAGRVTWPDGRITLDELSLTGPGIGLSVSGTGRAAAAPGEGIRRLDLDLTSGPVAIDVPNVTTGIARIDGAALSLGIEPATGSLDVRNATIELGEGFITLAGAIEGLAVDAPIAVRLDGNVETLALADVLQVWPPRVGHGARKWVAANVTGGVLDRGSVRIDAGRGDLALTPLPDSAIDVVLDYAGVDVRYLGDLPPISSARGTMTLTGNSFTATMTGGTIEPASGGLIGISRGSFRTRDFQIRGNDGFIEVEAAGAMAAVLSLIDEEPLGYASAFGIAPDDVEGNARLRIETTLPLRSQLRFEDVAFGVSGRVNALALPDLAEGLSVANGTMDVSVTNQRLVSKGMIDIAGIPSALTWTEDFNAGSAPGSTFEVAATLDDAARPRLGLDLPPGLLAGGVPVSATLRGHGPEIVSGRIEADLTPVSLADTEWTGWRKPAGEQAALLVDLSAGADGTIALPSIALTGEGARADGSARFGADGALEEADFPVVQFGQTTEVAIQAARPPENDGLRIDIDGPRFDARALLDGAFGGEGDAEDSAETAAAPLTLAARIGSVTAHGGARIDGVEVFLQSEAGITRQFRVTGRFADGGTMSAEMTPTTYGTRSVAARSDNAGALLRALDLYANVEGGTLTFDGTADDRAAGAPITGTFTGTDLRVKNAPVVANILSLGSLTGIGDQLQGDGILFTRLEAPVRISDTAIDIEEAIVSGPALGATIKGHVNRADDLIDLGGTIVPAYTVNSFFGNIPVLGDIIVGREGEGIFGITYALSGPAASPEITVNPLSAFVPGIFRRIFEMGGSPSEEVAEGSASDVPAPRPQPGNGG